MAEAALSDGGMSSATETFGGARTATGATATICGAGRTRGIRSGFLATGAARTARETLEWMLEQSTATVVDVAPLTRSDLRTFVERVAAERAFPSVEKDDKGKDEKKKSAAALADIPSSDPEKSSSGSGSNSNDSNDPSKEIASLLAANVGNSAGRHTVGLPAALHGAIFRHTHGDPLHAKLVASLLVAAERWSPKETPPPARPAWTRPWPVPSRGSP